MDDELKKTQSRPRRSFESFGVGGPARPVTEETLPFADAAGNRPSAYQRAVQARDKFREGVLKGKRGAGVKSPPTFYRMTRRGRFTPDGYTPNQYVEPKHPVYYYTLQLVFEGTVKLNHNEFILDNHDVATLVQGLDLRGSGERMLRDIMEAINFDLRRLDIPPLACKITIRGAEEESKNPAYLEYFQGEPQHLSLLQ